MNSTISGWLVVVVWRCGGVAMVAHMNCLNCQGVKDDHSVREHVTV